MATPIQSVKSVAYFQDTNYQPYICDKIDEDFNFPYAVNVTPASTSEDTKTKCAYWIFPLPEGYKYKKIRMKFDVNFNANAEKIHSQTYWCMAPFYQSDLYFPDQVLRNRVRSAAVGTTQIAMGWETAPAIYDKNNNGNTNMSHVAWPWGTIENSILGTGNRRTVYFDVYVGPCNYIAIGILVAPSVYIPTSGDKIYGSYTITINSLTVELDESVAPESYNFINPIYPIDVNVKQTNNTVFSWNTSNTFISNIKSLYELPFSGRSISYRKIDEEQPIEAYAAGEAYNLEILANTFSVGGYKYKIIMYDLYNNPIISDEFDFNVIGQDAAPTITNITDDSIPTISWTDTNQAGYELILKDSNQKVIYESGIVIGANLSQQIPKMLENGSYIVEIREINIYGILSEWGSAEFTLNLEEVDAPSDIIAVVNKDYGVEISGTPAEDAVKTFVVRKKARSEEIEVIGEYSGGVFTDFEVEGNTFYEYSLRNYDAAFADGAFVPVQVKVKEVVLHDAEDFKKHLELHLSEDNSFDIGWTESQSKTLYRTLGRPYPVKEIGEWKDTTRTFKAFVKEEDWDKVLDMYYNTPKIYFKANHEFFACDMEISDEGRYISGGYIIEFSITRISEDKEAII